MVERINSTRARSRNHFGLGALPYSETSGKWHHTGTPFSLNTEANDRPMSTNLESWTSISSTMLSRWECRCQ